MSDLLDHDEIVDAWGRQAAVALQRGIDERAVPHLPSSRAAERIRLGWRRPLAALAVVAAVVAGLTVIVRHADTSPATSGTDHWLLTDLPDGWSPISALDAGPSRMPAGAGGRSTAIYATDEAPVGPIFALYWTNDVSGPAAIDPTDGQGFNLTEATIGTRRAVFADADNHIRLLYVEVDGRWVLIRSAGLDDAALTTIANGLGTDAAGDAVLADAAVPPGLTRRAGTILEASSPEFLGIETSKYEAASDAGRTDLAPPYLSLSTYADGSGTAAWLGLYTTGLKPVTIGDTSGYYAPSTFASVLGMYTVAVWHQHGQLFALFGFKVDEEALIAAAGSLHRASDDEWSKLIAAGIDSSGPVETTGTVAADESSSASTEPPPSIVEPTDVDLAVDVRSPAASEMVLSATLPDGTPWSLAVTTVADSMRWDATYERPARWLDPARHDAARPWHDQRVRQRQRRIGDDRHHRRGGGLVAGHACIGRSLHRVASGPSPTGRTSRSAA